MVEHKIENGNGEYVKETTSRPKSWQQPKATNGSSMQRENPAHEGGPQLNKIMYQFSENGRHT